MEISITQTFIKCVSVSSSVVFQGGQLQPTVSSAQTQRYATIVPRYLPPEKWHAYADKGIDNALPSPLITAHAAWNNRQQILLTSVWRMASALHAPKTAFLHSVSKSSFQLWSKSHLLLNFNCTAGQMTAFVSCCLS